MKKLPYWIKGLIIGGIMLSGFVFIKDVLSFIIIGEISNIIIYLPDFIQDSLFYLPVGATIGVMISLIINKRKSKISDKNEIARKKKWPLWLRAGLIAGLIGLLISSLAHFLLAVIPFEESFLSSTDVMVVRSLLQDMAFLPSYPLLFLAYPFSYAIMRLDIYEIVIISFSFINYFLLGSLTGSFIEKSKESNKS